MADLTPSHVAAPAAPPLPSWLDNRTRWQAGWWAVGGVLAVGLLADQWLRNGASFGLAASATVIGAAAVVVWQGRVRRLEALVLIASAGFFALWFTLRASPWLLVPDLVAALGLVGLAASVSVRGSVFDLGIAELAARAIHSTVHAATGSAFVVRPVLASRGRIRGAAPLVRGVLIAVPIAALLIGLLASADPVFASFFNLNLDFGTFLLDVFFVGLCAAGAGGLLQLAAAEPVERIDGPSWRLGATEALVVLAILDAVFAAFAAAQVLAATGGAAATLREAGVTYADYARNGFFQLLWVSGITLAVLVVFSRATNLRDRKARRAFTVLACTAIALTLMVDVVAFRRLSLYEEAYGFTMLRLYSHVFAVWLAVVFAVLAADFLRVAPNRRWFVGATLTTAVAVLVGLNFASPEAIVVALNTNHAQIAHKIDSAYLAELSSDATPSLLATRDRIDPALRAQVTAAACAGPRNYSPAPAAFNLADAQAADARRSAC